MATRKDVTKMTKASSRFEKAGKIPKIALLAALTAAALAGCGDKEVGASNSGVITEAAGPDTLAESPGAEEATPSDAAETESAVDYLQVATGDFDAMDSVEQSKVGMAIIERAGPDPAVGGILDENGNFDDRIIVAGQRKQSVKDTDQEILDGQNFAAQLAVEDLAMKRSDNDAQRWSSQLIDSMFTKETKGGLRDVLHRNADAIKNNVENQTALLMETELLEDGQVAECTVEGEPLPCRIVSVRLPNTDTSNGFSEKQKQTFVFDGVAWKMLRAVDID